MTKNDILAAIRDTAAKNAGVPLGMQRFANETGITVHAWRGKYWLRWSEAVIEAGLSPNTLIEAYDDDFLLTKLAELTRRHKHFPTYGEMRFAKIQDTEFPGTEAFYRLGSKAERIERLRAYVDRNPENSDIVHFLPPSSASDGTKGKVQIPSDSDSLEGFVYMLKDRKYYKIGRTMAVPRRHREISLQLPEDPSLVHYIRTDDPEGIERYWHGRFAAFRAKGEWFSLTQKEVRAFKRRKFM